MTYSCAVWDDPSVGLERAQAAKYELICRKLGLRPGMRLLDVGCGWGGMVMHAARHHGVSAVGVTLSTRQVEWAAKAVADEGLGDRVEVRRQDYRDVDDGPYDAISSIGMFEHVGLAQLGVYFGRLAALLPPGGRLLNHGISRPPFERSRFARASFIDRYVFPVDLHGVGPDRRGRGEGSRPARLQVERRTVLRTLDGKEIRIDLAFVQEVLRVRTDRVHRVEALLATVGDRDQPAVKLEPPSLPIGNLGRGTHPDQRLHAASPSSSASIAALALCLTWSRVTRSSTSLKKPNTISFSASARGIPRLIR